MRWLVRLGVARGAVKRVLRRSWMAGGPNRPIDILYAGLRFRLYPGDNSTEAKMAFGSAERDRLELGWLRRLMKPGRTFVDVGANIGYYALLSSTLGASRVIAIEPNPAAYARLVYNVQINGLESRVEPVPVATGLQRGTAQLAAAGDLGAVKLTEQTTDGGMLVPVARLSDLLDERSVGQIEALKIDVEGMEDAALLPLLESRPPHTWPRLVIMEVVHQSEWKRNVLAVMLDRGYEQLDRSRSNVLLRRRDATEGPHRRTAVSETPSG